MASTSQNILHHKEIDKTLNELFTDFKNSSYDSDNDSIVTDDIPIQETTATEKLRIECASVKDASGSQHVVSACHLDGWRCQITYRKGNSLLVTVDLKMKYEYS
jgi:hypothetical protein